MEWLPFLLLIGLVFLMSRGHGGMGCCGGGHGHPSGNPGGAHRVPKAPFDPKGDVIELREDEYKVITTKDDRPPSS